jgi:hypothetical protein
VPLTGAVENGAQREQPSNIAGDQRREKDEQFFENYDDMCPYSFTEI